LNKGFSEEEAIKLVSNFQQEQSRKANTLENNLLKSELYRGDKNPMSLKSLSQRHNVDIEIAHKCTPCFGRTRDLHPFFGKKHSEKALEKIADSWHLKNPSWRSKGEIEVASFCSSLGLINENLKIGRWNVDIQFQDKPLIIEYFGDFWHMNPLLFEANDINQYTQAKASDVWARDARKLDELSHKGFKVFVVWEKAWKFSRVEQESQITKHFEEATR
jgi:G:T-mismatch repair DNA endonuclease (very short patch repair protein)